MSDDRAHVLDILAAGHKIQTFMAGVTEQRFLSDIEKQSSVLYQFTVLGEAARRVSTQFREAHPSVDWARIVAFRNRIVHAYDEVDVGIVWDITRQDLPRAIETLTPLMPKDPDAQGN